MNITSAQWLAFFNGAVKTVQLTTIAVSMGIIFGLLLALMRISRSSILKGISWVYIWVFRGTPLLLQIFVIYYSLPRFGITLPAFLAAVVAFSLNSAAYLAEVIRAAILSIDKGQMEASRALGMTYNQAMFKVIIPQSYRRLIPPLGNEFIILLKDSSLVSAIGMTELLRSAKMMSNGSGGKMIYYFVAAAIYLFFTSILTVVFQKLEKRYSIYE